MQVDVAEVAALAPCTKSAARLTDQTHWEVRVEELSEVTEHAPPVFEIPRLWMRCSSHNADEDPSPSSVGTPTPT